MMIALSGCEAVKESVSNVNLFSVEQDAQLGEKVSKEIESDPSKYPLLPERGNEQLYAYVRGITNKILNSGTVKHKDEFKWEVKIINDSKTLNAFCTPGGYIYVYTGLIKYLDSEDHLAGVMGHEIAHADLRHSTRQLTKMYGVSILAEVALGKTGMVKDIAAALVSLKFSRSHETESDNASVKYLCGTEYNAAGAAGFFEKIQAGGSSTPPEFISTHPSPTNRVENIKAKKGELGCKGSGTFDSRYAQMKRLVP
jgi:predicted Zn-dependent protease